MKPIQPPNYITAPLIESRKPAPETLTESITLPRRYSSDDKGWNAQKALFISLANRTPAPLMSDYKGYPLKPAIGPLDVICKQITNAYAMTRILEKAPEFEEEAQEQFDIAYRAYLQCVYSAWLCIELGVDITINADTNDQITATITRNGLNANPQNRPLTDIYVDFIRSWNGTGAGLFFRICREFQDKLNALSERNIGDVVTATLAVFRAIREMFNLEINDYRVVLSPWENQTQRETEWHLSRAQGACFLRRFITAHLIKGIAEISPTKPAQGLKLPGVRSLDLAQIDKLKQDMETDLTTGFLPLEMFNLLDKAQALFNPDPFNEFRFWNPQFKL